MVSPGDRVLIESEKVGVEPRAGVVTSVSGHIVHVHWDQGGDSSFIPAAGSMTVVGHESGG